MASNKMGDIRTFNPRNTQGMGGKGNCWDNAVVESFFRAIGHEWPHHFRSNPYERLHESIEDHIHRYDNGRPHSSSGYLSPLEMEMRGFIEKVA